MTLLDKSKYRNVSYLGQKIRETREKQNLLLRQVAAHIEVDTALMSKAERGERNLNRDWFYANTNEAEETGTANNDVDFLSNGIKIREDNNALNASGGTYIYSAYSIFRQSSN